MSGERKEIAAWNPWQRLPCRKRLAVSRLLVERSVGNAIFVFDDGERVSARAAPFDARVIGVAGWAEAPIASVGRIPGKGDSPRLPVQAPHAVNPPGQFRMPRVMIRGEASRPAFAAIRTPLARFSL